MENIEELEKIIEIFENCNFIWFVNEKNRYNGYKNLYEHEGNDVNLWTNDHKRIDNYLRNSYRKDKGLTVRDYERIQKWTINKYRKFISNEAEQRKIDIIKRIRDVAGDIVSMEMFEFNVNSITKIKVKGISSDCLLIIKFTNNNNKKISMKSWINETRRYF